MFWRLFKEKDASVLSPLHKQRWGISRGEHDGDPLIVRCNKTVGEWTGQAELPIKLGFAIPLNHPNEGGLPDAEENAALGQIEDEIVRQVFAATSAVFALALTTGIMKEFIFYIASDTDSSAIHARIRELVPTHEVQCIAVQEPGWDSYRAFVS